MNNGEQIFQKQNSEDNINKLIVQRVLYSKAKRLQSLLLIISVLLIIFVIFSKIFSYNYEENKFYIFFSVIIIPIELILQYYIDKYKRKAASIQEEFDINVFGIPKNETLNLSIIDLYEFNDYLIRTEKNVNNATDWYPKEIINIKNSTAVLLCQIENVLYDKNLRKKYNKLLYFLFFFFNYNFVCC